MEQNKPDKPWSLCMRTASILLTVTIIASIILGIDAYQRESKRFWRQKYTELEHVVGLLSCRLDERLSAVRMSENSADSFNVEIMKTLQGMAEQPACLLIEGKEIQWGYYLHGLGGHMLEFPKGNSLSPAVTPEPSSISRREILPGEWSVGEGFSAVQCRVYAIKPLYYRGTALGEIFTSLPQEAFLVPLKLLMPRLLGKALLILVLGLGGAAYVLKSGRFYGDRLEEHMIALEAAYQQFESLPELNDNLPLEMDRPLKRYRSLLKQAQELVCELSISFRMACLGEMIMAMAHDIRNPLAVIRASAEMGKATKDEHKRDILLENIITAEDTVEKFLNHYLDLTRHSLDVMERFRVRELIVSLQSIVKPMLTLKNISLEVAKSEQGLYIHGDRVALIQILLNLVSNAIDAIPEEGTINIKIYRHEQSVIISVADTGSGIPENLQDRVFDHFFTTKERKGFGLGLAFAKRVINNHGGRIWFESQVGKGTTFFIKLPLADNDPDEDGKGKASLFCL